MPTRPIYYPAGAEPPRKRRFWPPLAVAGLLLACGVAAMAADRGSAPTGHQTDAAERARIANEPAPARPTAVPSVLDGLYAVAPDETPSGFAVPRFVSLKFGRVNARTGPSRNHSIAYQYRRRGLPLIVVAETEMWRKVRDVDGDEAWVRKPALSGERYALFSTDQTVLSRSEPGAPAVARVERGALVKLEDCSAPDHCRIRTANGLKGFAPKSALWGAE
ncbi:MAG: SH3 domain-containing protein [Pseudomonadota bacterium]